MSPLLRGLWGVILSVAFAGPLIAADPPPIDLQLDKVRDRTLIEASDVPAYYGLLELSRRSDPAIIAQEAAQHIAARQPVSKEYSRTAPGKFPVFADMLSEPEAYRGKPIFVRGHSQEIKQYAAEENPFGITKLYECSLFTDDSQSHPLTVVFTEAPPGLPIGEETVDGLAFTGYHLKLRAYNARDGRTRLAPLVLAHRAVWTPRQKAGAWFSQRTRQFIAAGLTLLALAWVVIRWNQRPPRRSTPAEEVDLSTLDLPDSTARP